MKHLKLIIRLGVLALTTLIILPTAAKAVEGPALISANPERVCTMDYTPVCGADGVTYGNKCMAGDNEILHEGECDSEEPLLCTREYEPVCGKDNKTYANKCLAQRVGVDFIGKCESLEKILSPDQIKNFKLIKKDGKHLYGIRTNGKVTTDIVSEKSLEKISHPNQIKYFKVTKKENNTLYGIRLRKISHPQFICQYNNIKAMDNALWGLKK